MIISFDAFLSLNSVFNLKELMYWLSSKFKFIPFVKEKDSKTDANEYNSERIDFTNKNGKY